MIINQPSTENTSGYFENLHILSMLQPESSNCNFGVIDEICTTTLPIIVLV
jgi:hypothetical protein